MKNWLKRIMIYITENGHVYHFGDGKDFTLVKEFKSRWLSKDTFTYDNKDLEFAEYLRNIGFKEVRADGSGSVFRYKCKTGNKDMYFTNKLY